jgi:hypothetical protein
VIEVAEGVIDIFSLLRIDTALELACERLAALCIGIYLSGLLILI